MINPYLHFTLKSSVKVVSFWLFGLHQVLHQLQGVRLQLMTFMENVPDCAGGGLAILVSLVELHWILTQTLFSTSSETRGHAVLCHLRKDSFYSSFVPMLLWSFGACYTRNVICTTVVESGLARSNIQNTSYFSVVKMNAGVSILTPSWQKQIFFHAPKFRR